ncbi:MAG: tripartite tricarboxylate transporter substrate-binding protein, partial [Deltaproteobacteria bacterium]
MAAAWRRPPHVPRRVERGHAARGDVRALAISAGQRIPQAPQLPTFAECGVADAESYTWHMVLAPAGTPAEVVQA